MYNIYDIFESYKFNRLLDHDFNRIEEYINNFSIYNNHVIMEGYLDDLLEFSPVYEGIGDVVNKVVEFIKACWRKIKEWLDKVINLFRGKQSTANDLNEQIKQINAQGEKKANEKEDSKDNDKKEKDDEVEDLSKPEKLESGKEESKKEDKPKGKEIDLGDGEKFIFRQPKTEKPKYNDINRSRQNQMVNNNAFANVGGGFVLDTSVFIQKCPTLKDVLSNCKAEYNFHEFPSFNDYEKVANLINKNVGNMIESRGWSSTPNLSMSEFVERQFKTKSLKDWVYKEMGEGTSAGGARSKKRISAVAKIVIQYVEEGNKIINIVNKLKSDGEKLTQSLIKRFTSSEFRSENHNREETARSVERDAQGFMNVLSVAYKALVQHLGANIKECELIARKATALYNSAVKK